METNTQNRLLDVLMPLHASLAKKINTWQPIAVLPDADMTVMVHHPDWPEPVWIGYFDGEQWLWVDGGLCDPPPTHWMHFPEPPKEGGR